MPPDFLAIGHVVKDITADGWRPGGSVAYATLQASRLGLSSAAVTACSPELNPAEALPWAEWKVLPSASTTTFANVYEEGRRRQDVLARAASISITEVPDSWRSAPIVLLAPVIGEIGERRVERLPRASTIGISAQGWLRRLEGTRVSAAPFKPQASWLQGSVVFVSEEDLEEPERAAEWTGRVPVVVLTRGQRGCTVWTEDASFQVDAIAAPEVDPTGAGDAFAAAFLIRLGETKDPLEAAHFASAAASLAVRAPGLGGIGDRRAIESLLGSVVMGHR
jgi:1D-myo-inositol 3-kinase